MDQMNKIINTLFKTDLGYKYILNKIRNTMPFLKIQEENLRNFKIEKMDYTYHNSTNFIGEYVPKQNIIKIYLDLQGIVMDEREITEIFTHEFIHLLTSEYNSEGILLEGFNIKKEEIDSDFLGLNEGITQMITEDLLGTNEITAYPFQTSIARKLAVIIGKERIIELYSKHDVEGLINELAKIDDTFDIATFITQINHLHKVTNETNCQDALGLGTQIEENLIDLYLKSGKQKDKEFSQLIIDSKTARNLSILVPNCLTSGPDYLYYGIYPNKEDAFKQFKNKSK